MSGWVRRRLPGRLRRRLDERRLRKRIDAVRAQFKPRFLKAKTEDDDRLLDQELAAETEADEDELDRLITARLMKLADKWDVELPADGWTSDWGENYRFLSRPAQRKLQRKITDARKESVKWWVQVLTPIAAVLTGLAGALIGVLSFLRKP